MSKRAKRKSYGASKKQSSDLHHLKKKKKASEVPYAESGIKHSRVSTANY